MTNTRDMVIKKKAVYCIVVLFLYIGGGEAIFFHPFETRFQVDVLFLIHESQKGQDEQSLPQGFHPG